MLATHGASGNFRNQVTQAAGAQHARDQFEHMVSRITSTHGVAEARQVRGVLEKAFALCDFTVEVDRPRQRARKSLDELLSTELSLGL